jgi:two-component system, OmpR family, phosphate regulon sensor histidine kinase PhoR
VKKRSVTFHVLKVVGGMAGMLALFSGVLAGTYWLTSFVFQHPGQQFSALLFQIVNSVLALVLLFLLIGAASFIFHGRSPRDAGPFGQIIEAMGRIAKGDFDVRLGDGLRDDRVMGGLVESVNQMALELGQMEEMRQEFISNVSHEIQSPLTSIRGFAVALQSDDLSPEERAHYVGIIETESTRLSRLTDDLLKLASLESRQAKFEPKTYRLDKQIRNLVLACEPQWAGKGLEMDVSLEEASVTGDEDLLSQVWINLIHNGIKFTPGGGCISVGLRQDDGLVKVEVRDTGVGISEEDQARVFERFYKADKSRDRSKGGSGLGLSIARRIVEMHGGTIGLESRGGEGTTFRVSLPQAPQRTPPIPAPQ